MKEILNDPNFGISNFINAGLCHAKVYEDEVSLIAIVTELDDNPGPSITNSIESIIKKIEDQFGNLGKTIFVIENYKDNFGRDDYDLVLTEPTRWKRIPKEDILNPYKLAEAVCSLQL